jgi:hypothetical protein
MPSWSAIDDPFGRSAVVGSLEALNDCGPRIVSILRDDYRLYEFSDATTEFGMVGTVNGRLFHICGVHGGALDEPRLVAEEFDLERNGYVREVGQSG